MRKIRVFVLFGGHRVCTQWNGQNVIELSCYHEQSQFVTAVVLRLPKYYFQVCQVFEFQCSTVMPFIGRLCPVVLEPNCELTLIVELTWCSSSIAVVICGQSSNDIVEEQNEDDGDNFDICDIFWNSVPNVRWNYKNFKYRLVQFRETPRGNIFSLKGLTLSMMRIRVTDKITTIVVVQKSTVVLHVSPLYGKSQKQNVVLISVSLHVPCTQG